MCACVYVCACVCVCVVFVCACVCLCVFVCTCVNTNDRPKVQAMFLFLFGSVSDSETRVESKMLQLIRRNKKRFGGREMVINLQPQKTSFLVPRTFDFNPDPNAKEFCKEMHVRKRRS